MPVLETLVNDTRARAATIEHEWDARSIDWPLTAESVVVEVGGYCGRWALQIAERYAPRLYVFEPQGWAAQVCEAALGRRATVIVCALGAQNISAPMTKWETDGCSLVETGEHIILMREIGAAFHELDIDHIDLMLMNIEGYEYTLIPHMLNRGIYPDRLMAQFHPQPNDERTMAIYDQLEALGYRVAWTYGIVLTAWERI